MAHKIDPDSIPTCELGGMRIACLTRHETAELVLNVLQRPDSAERAPFFMTSSNGQVLALCARSPHTKSLYDQADVISADGQPMVSVSRWLATHAVPERCATTDFYHDLSKIAPPGTRYFLLGASEPVIERAVALARETYPHIEICGHADGYFAPEDEAALVERIASLKPDVLWIGMGVPRQQAFVVRNRERLTGTKVIKTCGGLFDFLSGERSRAPAWMQRLGLEWLYRVSLEPKRLFVRYFWTNLFSMYLLLTRTR